MKAKYLWRLKCCDVVKLNWVAIAKDTNTGIDIYRPSYISRDLKANNINMLKSFEKRSEGM